MEKILVFIPVYRCEKQLPRVLARIAALGADAELFSQILIVDNRSPDATREAALAAMRQLPIPAVLIENDENYSLGGSHKVAFRYAIAHGFDYVVVLHGDDQADLADLVPYLRRGDHRSVDSLLGSRFLKGSVLTGYTGFRVFGNHCFNAFLSVCCGRKITDLGSGLNLYSVPYLRSGFYMQFPNDLSFNVFLLEYGVYADSRFDFFPISWREEDQISNAKLFAQSRRIFGLTMQYVLHRKRLFAPRENEYTRIAYTYQVIGEHTP